MPVCQGTPCSKQTQNLKLAKWLNGWVYVYELCAMCLWVRAHLPLHDFNIKNTHIDKLDGIVNKCKNTYHRTIKLKPGDAKPSTYINSSK